MGSRALTQRRPSMRYSLLLFVSLGGLILFLVGCCITHSNGSSSTPRKLVAENGSPPAHPSSDCCATYYAPSLSQDSCGWLLNPILAAYRAHISVPFWMGAGIRDQTWCTLAAGAATECKAVHVGQIKAGLARGNHRHFSVNETLIVWGAEAKVKVEDPLVAKGYTEAFLTVDEVGVFGCPAGRAHAIANLDSVNTLHILGCQDGLADTSNTEYKVWTNLKEG